MNDIRKYIRKYVTIQTAAMSVIVLACLIFYTKSFYANKILIFDDKSDGIILLGICLLSFLTALGCIFSTIKNGKLIKKVLILQEESNEKDKKFEELLNLIAKQNINIFEQTNDIIKQNDNIIEQADNALTDLLKSNRHTRELILDNETEKRGEKLGA